MSANETAPEAILLDDDLLGQAANFKVDTLPVGGAVPPPEPPSVGAGANGAGPSGSSASAAAGTGTVLSAVDAGPVEDVRPHKKVAIVGYTSSKIETPFDDPTWELWGMNNLHKQLGDHVEKFTRWYDVHLGSDPVGRLDHPDGEGPTGDGDRGHLAWLRQEHPFPIYMLDPAQGATLTPEGEPLPPLNERLGFPSVLPIPVGQILTQFPRYFTNTVSWQIAHAILDALHDESYVLANVALFGIDMAVGTEYAEQRPSVEYFLGLLHGLGVEVGIPESSDLLKAPFLYGDTEQYNPMAAKVESRLRELHTQKTNIEQQMDVGARLHASVCGAIDSFAYMQAAYLPPKTSAGARDAVKVPAGSLGPVAQMLAEGEAADRHKKEE